MEVPPAAPKFGLLSSSKYRTKTGLEQDAGDCLALVALDFDPPFLHRASSTTGFLYFLGEGFFFGQTDASETRDDRHGLAATMCGLANDIHPPTVFLWCDGWHVGRGGARLHLRGQRQGCVF